MNEKPIQNVSEQFALHVPDRPEGRSFGEFGGTGIGNSIEYQEHREYQPGDDIRRIDWNAYARTGNYVIKQFREEVHPRVEVIVDGSRSIAITDDKKHQIQATAVALMMMAENQQMDVTGIFAGTSVRELEGNWVSELRRMNFQGTATLPEQMDNISPLLRRGSVRFVISDFLFPEDPESFLPRFARNGARTNLVQILAETERNPDLDGGNRLTDVETGQTMNCYVTENEIREYRNALRTLSNNLRRTATYVGAQFAQGSAETSLGNLFRDVLLPAEMVSST